MAGTYLAADRTIPFNLGKGHARLEQLYTYFNNVGNLSLGRLRVGANVANGETVTIGTDVFEVDVLASNPTAGAATVLALANTTAETLVTTSVAHGLVVGDLAKIDSEFIKVKSVISTTVFSALRARCGTSAASHSGGATITVSDVPGSVVGAGHIPVAGAALTPTAFLTAFVAEINADSGVTGQSASCRAIKIGTALMLLIAESRDLNLALATTETLAGSGNVWDAATMSGGRAPAARRMASGTRVPLAAEVTEGNMYLPVDFAPNSIIVRIAVTLTGVEKAWDGGALYTAAAGGNPGYVVLDNTGSTDWAATDTVHFIFAE